MTRPCILYVDDNSDDAFLLGVALQKVGLVVRLEHVPDGYEALRYLLAQGPYHDRSTFPYPDLVLLDIKMPIMDGFEFLERVRSDRTFNTLPIFVLSSSNFDEDRQLAARLGANGFLVKDLEFREAIHEIALRCGPPPGQSGSRKRIEGAESG